MAMPTRKNSKKNKKNKSLKFKAGNSEAKEREGVIDLIGDKINNATSSALSSLADTGLKIVGLEKIDRQKEEIPTTNIVSNVSDIADKTSASLITNVNEVLGSDLVNKTTKQAAKDTAVITSKLLNNFNKAINSPEIKQEVKEALDNAGEVASVAVDALKEPFSKVVDIAAESTQKATSAAVSGAIKVSTDALSAVPFWGAFIDLGKIMNDGSKAASAVVEAGTEALEVSSDAFIDTKKNFEKGLKELDKQKKMSKQILNRTTNSIDEFENPTIIKGGTKTKRRLFKRKLNTKRVRFAN
jgi:transcriptional regulator of aromatic amino acid metabolism